MRALLVAMAATIIVLIALNILWRETGTIALCILALAATIDCAKDAILQKTRGEQNQNAIYCYGDREKAK